MLHLQHPLVSLSATNKQDAAQVLQALAAALQATATPVSKDVVLDYCLFVTNILYHQQVCPGEDGMNRGG